ncbi:hypothetical protein ACFLVW_08220, partial [Chloroflexota bacterium]
MPKFRTGSLPVQIAVGILGAGIIALAVIYVFHLAVLMFEAFLYSVLALAIPVLFLTKRASSRESDAIPWYDLLLSVIGAGIGFYFVSNAQN